MKNKLIDSRRNFIKSGIVLTSGLPFIQACGLLTSREESGVDSTQNYIIFSQRGRYGGWPANHGIWNWGDEILISFQDCEHSGEWRNRHSVVPDCERYTIFARSLVGGRSWRIERPAIKYTTDETGGPVTTDDLMLCPGSIDFSHPDFCAQFTLSGTRARNPSWWSYSLDRGHHWIGPYSIDPMGFTGVNARTDYHVLLSSEMMVFLTVTKGNGDEGRVVCAKLSDGGAKWELLGCLGDEPAGWEIMPASAQRKNGDWVVIVRVMEPLTGENSKRFCLKQYVSSDGGKSWRCDGPITPYTTGPGGNPSALVAMKNGNWCVSYGMRDEPFGMCCMFSHDEGRSWLDEKILRTDAACWDIGYPCMVENARGELVVGYYYNTRPDEERFIAATIFTEDDF